MKDTRVQRLLSELLLPILGILFWHWGTAFLLWFMLLDVVSGLVTGRLHPVQKTSLKQSVIQVFELLLICLVIYLLTNDIVTSFSSFFAYEDMGVAQGYFIVPLMVFGEWLRLTMSKKTGVYFFNSISYSWSRMAFMGVFFVLASFGPSELLLSLALISLASLSILWFPQDIILI
ncbi:MAG: hypothetical protein EBS17_03195 [Flavobacteriia bacterium]|nr:hypothetical protein [Flavobacteriia bacterium]